MSDIHTMLGSDNGEQVSLIFHYPVPDVDNDVFVNYRTVVKDYISDHTSVVPGLDAAEQTQLNNGELFEFPTPMATEQEKGLVQLQNRARDLYTELQGDLTNKLRNRFKYTAASIDIV